MKINGIEHVVLLVPESEIKILPSGSIYLCGYYMDNAFAQYQANAKEWVKGVVEELKLGDKCFMYNNCGDTFTEWNKGWEKGYNAAIDDVDTKAKQIIDEIGGEVKYDDSFIL